MEDFISEEERQEYSYFVEWPTPIYSGIFPQITNINGFNNIIGNPNNWQTILNDKELFDSWVFPNASLLFGKTWFNKIKNLPKINNGAPFPLFSNFEKEYANQIRQPIEKTPAGKERIARINEKIASSLKTYLQGNWYNFDIKPPSGYIREAIKNDTIRDVAEELGFKLQQVRACPLCLSKNRKSKVIRHSSNLVSCEICDNITKNLKLNINNLNGDIKKLYQQYLITSKFVEFSPLVCVCPDCSNYIPFDYNTKAPQNDKVIVELPAQNIDCMFCNCSFITSQFTGLPNFSIWRNPKSSLDEKSRRKVNVSDILVYEDCLEDSIVIKEKLQILIDEIVLRLAKIEENSVANLLNYYFYLAVINWIKIYSTDAVLFLFEDIRGEEASVHKEIFDEWTKLLEKNIHKFKKFDSSIKKLSDFGWFCRPPKFSFGPKSIFSARVECDKIANETKLARHQPRIAKVLSIKKDGINYTNEIKSVDWQKIILNPYVLKDGDEVRVAVLLMDGHPDSAPIKRIKRLKNILKPIIEKIVLEENGESFKIFG